MADSAAVPSCARLHLRRIRSGLATSIPKSVHIRVSRWQQLSGKCKMAGLFPSTNTQVGLYHFPENFKGGICMKGSSLKCCLGALTNSQTIMSLNWVPLVDQILLTASVVLAYMAGVIPNERIFSGAGHSTMTLNSGASNSTSYGTQRIIQINIKDYWSQVEGKIADTLDAIERDPNLDSRAGNHRLKQPLNLFAVFECPRLRLLWFTLQRLRKEVNEISQTYEDMDNDGWLDVSSAIIQGSVQPVCMKWLQEELALENEEADQNLLSRISAILRGDEMILQNINRLGKAELYAELLFFIRFGSLRHGCYYDNKFLAQYGVDILEDLVITLADGITSIYLELISVDSYMSNEMNGLDITLCNLSTRLLQKLRNEVALNRWLQQNFESVVSMYEDRFELFVLQRERLEDPCESQRASNPWWKNFNLKKPVPSSLNHVLIKPLDLPAKRTKELRALTGWKYYFSLFLELSDIGMPLVRVVVSKVRDAVSFFLVSLIGRSLGLIYSGIRQSLGWRR